MFRNYVKVALRNILRYRGYSFINIAGLAIGMTVAILIFLWANDELSYDKFHKNAASLYRVEQEQNYSGSWYHVNVTPFPMGPGIKDEIPEIVESTRYYWLGLLLRYKKNAFFENGIRAVDPSFFNMFTFPIIKGDKNTLLNDIFSLVLSEEMATKYFGEEDPVGKVITINNQFDFTVTGVFENVPNNSFLQFDMVVPFDFTRKIDEYYDSWTGNSIFTFVQLHTNSVISEINEKISALRHRKAEESIENPERLTRFQDTPRVEFSVMPYTKIRLHGYFGFGHPTGAIQYVYIFSLIALFVLIIACINFMNLSTARSANRAKEIGLRKVVGAQKINVIKQFFGESFLMSFIALLVAIVLTESLLNVFNQITSKKISFDFFHNPIILIGLLGITLFTAIIAGSYPALFLSSFQPAKVFQGALKSGSKNSMLRKSLVIIQFTLSIFLIIGTGVVYNQIIFMKNKNLGFDKEHLIYIRLRGDMLNSYEGFKTELNKNSNILAVTASTSTPSSINSNSSGAEWDGKDPELDIPIGMCWVDYDYIKTAKIELLEGRTFSKKFSTDTSEAFLVNEEVLKLMGTQSAVGKNFNFVGQTGRIIGVMKNFHYQTVRDEIEPLAIMLNPNYARYILIRIKPGDIPSSINFIRNTWQRILPNYPFEYNFLDEDFNQMYQTEQRMGELLKYFAIMAIVIACLGLFGLASFTAEQKTKEIGIRKVVGASEFNITFLLCKEFLILILISNIITWPISWYIMNNWLQDFAYRTGPNWMIFVAAGVSSIIIALITVSFQAIKASLANPVVSLKYE